MTQLPMKTFDTIREAFHSGNYMLTGDREVIMEIAFLIDEGSITLKIVTVATKDAYRKLLDDAESLKSIDEASGGHAAHIALKVLAATYLKKERLKEPVYEHPFCGYRPDVQSSDDSITIECGHTQNAEKIFAYFQQGNAKECIQIPYPNEQSDLILGYRLTANKDLHEFLTFWEAEKRANLKRSLTK